jgi:hypothetical protein
MILFSEEFIHKALNQSQMDFARLSAHGKFTNSSLGGTDSARASLMMFLKGYVRSPRSTPPT